MEETRTNKQGYTIHHITKDDPEYPERLRKYSNMPEELYWCGTKPRPQVPTVAIVGARMCSAYGRIQAFEFAKAFSEAGVQVISGMAYGIDSEGHKGALEGKTPTYAVLGCGPEMCYPKSNRSLYQRILRQGGGILSEYPPGTPPLPHHFPIRNRIISALADVVLIIEAKDKSGSLITANYALEQGKSIYALPGAVNDELSIGCHKLIYDGAGIAYCPEVILSELGVSNPKLGTNDEKTLMGLETDLIMVYSCLDLRPRNLDYLLEETGLKYSELCNVLLQLELKGLVREVGHRNYIRNR